MLYASDRIKKIVTNKVIISLYFIPTNSQFCNSFPFKNLTFNFFLKKRGNLSALLQIFIDANL